MLFPEIKQRVIYKKKPLIEVVCQLRFPTILRIDAQEPADFQERIRKFFPLYQEKREGSLPVPEQILQSLPKELINTLGVGNKNYEFLSENETLKINLTRDFVAMTATDYEKWENFLEYFSYVFTALTEIYEPAHWSRIGLRYRNIIQRSELGFNNENNSNWKDLLNKHILGELDYEPFQRALTLKTTILNLKLDEVDGAVNMRHGLVMNNEQNEICYLIDNDFYTDKRIEVRHGLGKLTEFNSKNRQLFRWCITDKLHTAMEPVG